MDTKQFDGHTPGPWTPWQVVIPFRGWEVIDATTRQGIARTPNTRPTDEKNACLIAAAPRLLAERNALLAACKASLFFMPATARETIQIITAAIAQAENESP